MISHSPRRLHVALNSPIQPSGQIASTVSPKGVSSTSTPVITVAPQPVCSIGQAVPPHRTAALQRLVPGEGGRAGEGHGAFVAAIARQFGRRVGRGGAHIVRSAGQLEHLSQTHYLHCTSRPRSMPTALIHRLFPRPCRRAGSSNRPLIPFPAAQFAGFSGLGDLIEVALIHIRGALHRLCPSLSSLRTPTALVKHFRPLTRRQTRADPLALLAVRAGQRVVVVPCALRPLARRITPRSV